jgi:hypothetical protein
LPSRCEALGSISKFFRERERERKRKGGREEGRERGREGGREGGRKEGRVDHLHSSKAGEQERFGYSGWHLEAFPRAFHAKRILCS